MGKRADFGSNWSDFVTNWCSGVTPQVDSEAGWRSLGVIERFCPEQLDVVLKAGLKGIAIVVPMIELGLTLTACENLIGFDRLLQRMKKGESSVLSEARFAAALLKLGYTPILEPHIGEKRLDALISAKGEKVYFEIVTPEKSDAMRQAYSEMQSLAEKIREEHAGMDVSIFLLIDPATGISDAILAYLKGLTPSSEETHKMADVALIKYNTFAREPLAIEQEHNNIESPKLFVAAFSRKDDGTWTRINVGVSISDKRAQRILSAEAEHFSRGEINILVMDVSMIPCGIKCWSPLIQRRFQPRINRRFSAVVLFSCCIESGGMSWSCSVLPNPHACRQAPKHLIDDLARLGRA